MGEKRGMQALETWCRQMTAGYNGVNVTNMTSSWKNGLAFCALIHHFRPDLIDFSSLSAENVYHNNQLAFSVAEQHLGIPALLDAEDMVKCNTPDRLSILTYLSQFFQVLAGSPKSKGEGGTPIKRSSAVVGSPSVGPASTGGTPVKIFARQLQSDGSPVPRARRSPDLCVSCKNSVFLAERLMVNGRLHHRVCFRCARCKSQLSLANYYETEHDQYCCETCPDEVTTTQETPTNKSTVSVDLVGDSSAIVTSGKNTISDQNVLETTQLSERLPSLQEKRFFDGMLGGSDEVVVVVEVTQKVPPPVKGSEISSEDVPEQKAAIVFSVDNRVVDSVPADDVTAGLQKRREEVVVSVEPRVVVIDKKEVDHDAADTRPQDLDPAEISQSAVAIEEATNLSSDGAAREETVVPISSDDVKEEAVPLDVKEEVEQLDVKEDVEQLDIKDNVEQLDVKEDVEQLDAKTDVVTVVRNDEQSSAVDEKVTIPEVTLATDNVEEIVPSPEPPTSPLPLLPEETDAKNAAEGEATLVVPKPRQRKGKRSDSRPQSTVKVSTESEKEHYYPEELNPFDDEPESATTAAPNPSDHSSPGGGRDTTRRKLVIPAPKISLNPFGSDDDDDEGNSSSDPGGSSMSKIRPDRPPPPVIRSPSSLSSSVNVTPSPKKRAAPAPPPPKPQRTPSLSSTHSGDMPLVTLRRTVAPPPPPPTDSPASPVPAPRTTSLPPSPKPKPRLLPVNSPPLPPLPRPSEKEHKDLSNLHMQGNANKDSHGQWKRKKGPAPPRPSPQKRQLRKMPIKVIQQELEDIEVKQVELERQGVNLEEAIRALTEPEEGSDNAANAGIHVEEMILQLFDLVNEKNDLLRRQTELMYIRRQQRLEEEHAELEYQIRCLMDKPCGEKTDEDRLREEELINRLVEVVHRRAEIVDCLEMDRRRQEEEDQSIQQHLDVFNSRGAAGVPVADQPADVTPPKGKSKGLKMHSPIKLIKKDKLSKKSKKNKIDADKDIDESENEVSVTGTNPAAAAATAASPSTSTLRKEKDKSKTKSWFTK